MNNHTISGKTQICGIIGDPIDHTISPIMHNVAFGNMGLDYVYVPFKVKTRELGQAINGMKGLNIRGFNVTIPHKVEVMQYLDEVDELASSIGAVNTIVNEDGSLKGYNTDASGFLQALKANKIEPVRKNITILGAGGAARAISFVLADRGAELTILNRHLDSAQELANRIFRLFRKEVAVLELGKKNLEGVLNTTDILINTTSVGMAPDTTVSPVPASLLKSDLAVFDIVYNPLKTRLLAESEKSGAIIISGLEMLVFQGAVAFKLWTGKEAPVKVMRTAGLKALENYEI
jgi:shikimate dehydrogenase